MFAIYYHLLVFSHHYFSFSYIQIKTCLFTSQLYSFHNCYKIVLVSAISVVSSEYLRLVILVPPMLITPSRSSNASLIMFSAYMLNSRGDKIHPCLTPFLMFIVSVSPNYVLIVASCFV